MNARAIAYTEVIAPCCNLTVIYLYRGINDGKMLMRRKGGKDFHNCFVHCCKSLKREKDSF